mmetsp:Transcript_20260/g.64079  ORF Transcript_20260/g.64079 Transcript_20260/m.64079 type:complete len:298 (-) Transcript_20260:1955-2848(-)
MMAMAAPLRARARTELRQVQGRRHRGPLAACAAQLARASSTDLAAGHRVSPSPRLLARTHAGWWTGPRTQWRPRHRGSRGAGIARSRARAACPGGRRTCAALRRARLAHGHQQGRRGGLFLSRAVLSRRGSDLLRAGMRPRRRRPCAAPAQGRARRGSRGAPRDRAMRTCPRGQMPILAACAPAHAPLRAPAQRGTVSERCAPHQPRRGGAAGAPRAWAPCTSTPQGAPRVPARCGAPRARAWRFRRPCNPHLRAQPPLQLLRHVRHHGRPAQVQLAAPLPRRRRREPARWPRTRTR